MAFPIQPFRNFSERFMSDSTEIRRHEWLELEPGYPEDYPYTASTVMSYGTPLGQRELMRAERAGFEAEQVRHLPIGTDVTVEDWLRIDGVDYEITAIEEGTEELKADIAVYVKRSS